MDKDFAKGTKVIAKDGAEGTLTGSTSDCQLTGCRGLRLYVRWSDGKLTKPCTKGMQMKEGVWHIL